MGSIITDPSTDPSAYAQGNRAVHASRPNMIQRRNLIAVAPEEFQARDLVFDTRFLNEPSLTSRMTMTPMLLIAKLPPDRRIHGLPHASRGAIPSSPIMYAILVEPARRWRGCGDLQMR